MATIVGCAMCWSDLIASDEVHVPMLWIEPPKGTKGHGYYERFPLADRVVCGSCFRKFSPPMTYYAVPLPELAEHRGPGGVIGPALLKETLRTIGLLERIALTAELPDAVED